MLRTSPKTRSPLQQLACLCALLVLALVRSPMAGASQNLSERSILAVTAVNAAARNQGTVQARGRQLATDSRASKTDGATPVDDPPDCLPSFAYDFSFSAQRGRQLPEPAQTGEKRLAWYLFTTGPQARAPPLAA